MNDRIVERDFLEPCLHVIRLMGHQFSSGTGCSGERHRNGVIVPFWHSLPSILFVE
jgi:hypothetical protein